MTTMRDIVTRAYRKIGVTPMGDAPEAEEAEHGFDTLKSMLAEWSLRGVYITPSATSLSSRFPMGAAFEDGAVYMLAARLSPDFARPASFDADDYFRAVQAAYMEIPSADMPSALTRLPSRTTGRW